MSFCLQMHAGYGCRHIGACCTANWMIPAEPQVLRIVRSSGILGGGSASLFVPETGGGDPVVARRDDGTCVFFERDGDRLCTIHRIAGAAALPSACRHFPREVLRDPRGTFISLSHFCPTAARLLLDANASNALEVITAPASLCLEEPVEGMDALDALPPLVRPGLLGDFEGYEAWERGSLAVLARPDLTPSAALDIIDAATEDIREWVPGAETLATRVVEAFGRVEGSRLRDDLPGTHLDTAVNRYLGARLFGNWMAYQGRGWRSIVAWLRLAGDVLNDELLARTVEGRALHDDDFVAAVGAADLFLLHTTDSEVLARRFAAAEGPEPR